MPKEQVLSHMKAMDMYRVDSGDANLVAYVTPDPSTNTKNGVFLKFDDNKLVEIASTKTDMDSTFYKSYMDKLIPLTKQWKAAGMQTVIEDNGDLFVYKDDKSIASISGSTVSGSPSKYQATVTFTEKNFHEGNSHTSVKPQ